MSFVEVARGDSPLVLGLPHTGTDLTHDAQAALNETGHMLADTDWHIHQLYDGLIRDITTVRTTLHRYVIDVNRDPSGQSLYPGQNTTGLVPLSDFDGQGIWKTPPTGAEIEGDIKAFHQPYHIALSNELKRVRDIHGFAILYDCHSIRSHIPFLFEGTLPDFNIGTNGGQTCAPEIETGVLKIAQAAKDYSTVLNGRFKGGWTTRHYGQPENGVHAIQMELAQSIYLAKEAPPWSYDPARADAVRIQLTKILTFLQNWRPA